jgi:hypothetical protein
MPNTEHNRMDPGFEWRLRAALDRITPPLALPRYASMSVSGVRPWRVAPYLLAAATAVLFALAATATTGSPNPAVWTSQAGSTITAVEHAAAPSPSPTPSPAPPPAASRKVAAAAPTHQPEHSAAPRPEPSDRPQESPRAQPTASPSPWPEHSATSSPSPSPTPSPGLGEH